MNPELQKVIDYHLENSGGLVALTEQGATNALQRYGVTTAAEYIRKSEAHFAAIAAEFESLPKIPRGHRLADNNSWGGVFPSDK
ncbi:hypothetical protein [Sinimarinibacterium sp. NLF-5-8]|uniref:hypothetical protein n=1 Tax=Sinimarinibacterium sp. NLF-5-8 TaxID=2698684 RepID=UPI00137BBA9C|nr:hypothetical protein [Sinimarinibacterium sp. NLF-5-8]QHS09456.1 hypothetical protein GT972_04305 [Sinimarinibacterium sp. NLF-5-8]